MLFEYKKLGIKIEARSKEEAISKVIKARNFKITAMAFDKKKMEEEIINQTSNIISWWCLCWYLKNVENKNGLLHHEKVKLAGLLSSFNRKKIKGGNTEEIKQNLFKHRWIDLCEYDRDPDAVRLEFEPKFDEENIREDIIIFNKIGKEFGKEIVKLIDLICKGTELKIKEYVKNKF